ncbi:response regulator [Sphingomicrobium clamense]|uniref:Response regulator transcription factor n=1 Tax=Sphingomicrobium clamense TaxID=2851013 RepID=A0ABS6V498_9SPHN|nr:response regulator transcription factor [Sphingomicrobium sp. B8]MBW0144370.1 response regulator transcription factor [Sphingomicrobium sp. B8]
MARIIIADDDPVIRHIVTGILEQEGHLVGALPDGSQVVDVVLNKRPHLLILDCSMPGKAGLDALRELRASGLGRSFPVLVLTGRTGRSDEAIAYEAGADDYLRKPIDPDELVIRVDALLEKAMV